eukprot:122650_1
MEPPHICIHCNKSERVGLVMGKSAEFQCEPCVIRMEFVEKRRAIQSALNEEFRLYHEGIITEIAEHSVGFVLPCKQNCCSHEIHFKNKMHNGRDDEGNQVYFGKRMSDDSNYNTYYGIITEGTCWDCFATVMFGD